MLVLCAAVLPAVGLDAVGTGGLPGAGGLTAPGFAATGGGFTLGFVATGGGGFAPSELEGREFAGVVSAESVDTPAGFFQGVVEPCEGIRPGKTATGFADALAVIDLTVTETLGVVNVEDAAGIEGGGLRAGAGGAAGGARGFLGTSSR